MKQNDVPVREVTNLMFEGIKAISNVQEQRCDLYYEEEKKDCSKRLEICSTSVEKIQEMNKSADRKLQIEKTRIVCNTVLNVIKNVCYTCGFVYGVKKLICFIEKNKS